MDKKIQEFLLNSKELNYDGDYITVKKQQYLVTELTKEKIKELKDSLETKVDWKSLSHALRVAMEVEELLLTGFVKFPLQYRDRLKEVKEGRADVEEALDEVRDTLGRVDVLLENTNLPEKSDKTFMNAAVLSTLTVTKSSGKFTVKD